MGYTYCQNPYEICLPSIAGSLRFEALLDDEPGESAAETHVGPEHVIALSSGSIQVRPIPYGMRARKGCTCKLMLLQR